MARPEDHSTRKFYYLEVNMELTIRRIDDMHHHFRIRPTLDMVLSHLIPYCARAIAMPNLSKAVLNGSDVIWYRNEFTTVQNYLQEGGSFPPPHDHRDPRQYHPRRYLQCP